MNRTNCIFCNFTYEQLKQIFTDDELKKMLDKNEIVFGNLYMNNEEIEEDLEDAYKNKSLEDFKKHLK